MGISLGLVGLGSFGKAFADLFRSHPLVDRVALCDRERDRIEAIASRPGWDRKFNAHDAYVSLDDMLATDVDAVVIITQPWLHAPQCVQAMEAGKHVYSAVPVISIPDGDEILDWCDKIVETSRRSGMSYMLGETTYYRPEAMFCRRKAKEGAFGDFVYAEGEYFHDVDAVCSLRKVIEHRLNSAAGREWVAQRRRYDEAGCKDGPMHYPTHSTSGPVCVMDAHALNVTAYGYRNRTHDDFFEHDAFSNEMALFKMSNGATVRICECREVAGFFHESETFRVMGTAGSFAEKVWRQNNRSQKSPAKPLESRELTVQEMRNPLPGDVALAFAKVAKPEARTVDDFTPQGHGGSHPYLVHEFITAVAEHRQPIINAWEAARYMAMGVMAHKSALQDGKTLDVPDWGDAPE